MREAIKIVYLTNAARGFRLPELPSSPRHPNRTSLEFFGKTKQFFPLSLLNIAALHFTHTDHFNCMSKNKTVV